MAEPILHVRVPRELEQRIEELAARLSVKKSTAVRLLLRRALNEPLGVAAITEKVSEVSEVLKQNAAIFTKTLNELFVNVLEDLDLAGDDALPNVLELPGIVDEGGAPLEPEPELEHNERFTPAPAPVEPLGFEDEGDHGAGVRFSGARRKTGPAVGRKKAR